ncbi:MAG: hypothetical protein GX874_02725 [Smithella sp.]|jgi:acyl-CoA hydrolase|nr:hypothetical protein [Smithella sp.]
MRIEKMRQPMDTWEKQYKNKIFTAKQALKSIKDGDRVVVGHTCKCIKERARALIGISHPDFRALLESSYHVNDLKIFYET